MQYITTGNRIAVENFTIGDLYTITFESGTYINCACIGIGANFVSFQRNLPELLFTLTMETAELVSSIDLYAGGTGTNNYNELQNKPLINDVELVGNKSLSDLGIQAEITEESPLSSALVSGLGSAATAESSDFATAAQGALAASAVQPAALDAALALKQDALSSAQLAAVNSGITSTDVEQITTNKNNISSLQDVALTAQGEILAQGTNLNNITTAGIYRANTNSLADSLYNSPTQYSFRMEVSSTASGARPQQIIYPATNDGKVYRRVMSSTSGVWFDWYEYNGTIVQPVHVPT